MRLFNEMNTHSITVISPRLLPLFGLALAALFWVVDSAIDVLVFEEEHTFLQSLLDPEPVELWMRSLVVVILLLFAFSAKKMLIMQQKVSDELSQYKYHLQGLVY